MNPQHAAFTMCGFWDSAGSAQPKAATTTARDIATCFMIDTSSEQPADRRMAILADGAGKNQTNPGPPRSSGPEQLPDDRGERGKQLDQHRLPLVASEIA